MAPARSMLVVAAVLSAVACGVPEQKYKAALADADRAVREGSDQRKRADACEQSLKETTARADGCEQRLKEASARADAAERHGAELSDRLADLEKAVSAASADAARQRELAAQLAKAREALEAEKSALEKRSAEYESLASSLDSEIKAGRIQVSELKGKVTVRMAERVLFPSGSATVSREGRATLAKIADAFKNVQGRIIRVEGHTDNVPIKTPRFPSNWELSAARAIAVVRILQDDGVDPALLGAAGYAQYQPIAPNDTAEGRAQNRRIEISLAAPLGVLPTAKP